MQILRYEWMRMRSYILIWAAVIAACIFSMTPIYYGMIGTADTLPADFAKGGFFEAVGVSLELLTEPLGIYAFLTSFFMIAGGVFGMHTGLCLYTRECTENTAEYLYTKPGGRRMIYTGKLLCALIGAVSVGTAYLLASRLTMQLFCPDFPRREFWLIAISFMLLTLFFTAFGLAVGIYRPNNRSPLLTAGLTVFAAYCITSFSRTVNIRIFGFLSPFSFFSPSVIHETAFYQWDFTLWYMFLSAAILILAYRKIVRRDIALVL